MKANISGRDETIMANTNRVKADKNALEEIITNKFNDQVEMTVEYTLNQEKLFEETMKFFQSLNNEQRSAYLDLESLEVSVQTESLKHFYRLGYKDGLALGRSI